ncbi:LacI family DNA-binding transcriptional regulator [Oceanomicrobium pacificus]|uniref:Substrate-binding domain-containing protein n=1 Tax=Oceanomicrobium pacificus TaxID=2692916 RepID=A0A6B0TMD7_9RHOB|nr:LacI family DNA-binding transcriptional regulator [Oceanomicrobium pacificus]MXU65046.1 substrate-binding domain-containing protein [Oceanomicrobium pacificus]
MSKRVTIKSIAEELGISHMTVSRALSGNPNVQKSTADAVRKRAEEMGYVRNAAARAMRGDESRIVGLLVPNITNDFYARFANSFAEACDREGLHLIIHLTKDNHELEGQAMLRLRELQARAVVSVPTPLPDGAQAGATTDMHLVQLIRERGDGADSVLVDDAGAIRDAVLHLHGRGHRRIAYIGAPDTLSSGRGRLAAFRSGITAAGLEFDTDLVRTEPPSIGMGERLTRTIVSHSDATALVCGGFEISNGALKAAMQLGTLNRGLDFVGYGNPDFYAWIGRGLTTIDIPVVGLADCAVRMVGEEGEVPLTGRQTFPARLVVRD